MMKISRLIFYPFILFLFMTLSHSQWVDQYSATQSYTSSTSSYVHFLWEESDLSLEKSIFFTTDLNYKNQNLASLLKHE